MNSQASTTLLYVPGDSIAGISFGGYPSCQVLMLQNAIRCTQKDSLTVFSHSSNKEILNSFDKIIETLVTF